MNLRTLHYCISKDLKDCGQVSGDDDKRHNHEGNKKHKTRTIPLPDLRNPSVGFGPLKLAYSLLYFAPVFRRA
ncbi:hypothetical protein Mapa_017432 [Marchantia paleacea]|nr:hypothetical protein Mapa_017432 [Marchantia paleacea]